MMLAMALSARPRRPVPDERGRGARWVRRHRTTASPLTFSPGRPNGTGCSNLSPSLCATRALEGPLRHPVSSRYARLTDGVAIPTPGIAGTFWMTARTQTIRVAKWLRRPELVAAISESLLLLASAEICLRVSDLPKVARWFGATLEFTDAPPLLAVEVLNLSASERRRLAVLSRVAQRWPLGPRGACLRHSLSAAHVVRSRRPRLRLSVGRTNPGDIAAHAWIEVNGTAVTDPGDFEPLARRPKPEQGPHPGT